jgi:type IV pilus assembly protein PilM
MLFFNEKPFGLDIYDNSIKVAALSGKPRAAKVNSYGNLRIESGIVENGRVLDKKKLAQAVKDVLSKAKPRPVRSKRFIFALPESKVFLHTLSLPNDVLDFNQIVRRRVAEFLPFDLSEVYDDYKVDFLKGESRKVLYAAAQKGIVNEFLEVFQIAEIEPLAINFESAAIARALFNQSKAGDGYLLADVGSRTTILSIYDFGSIKFTENIPIAGNYFTKTIMGELNISFMEAENLKKSCGLNPKVNKGRVASVLQKPIQNVIMNIEKAVDYYRSKTGRKIKEIILCGGSAQMPHLSRYLQSNVNIRARVGDPLTKITNYRKQKMDKITSATVIGLALQGLEKKPDDGEINLLDDIK